MKTISENEEFISVKRDDLNRPFILDIADTGVVRVDLKDGRFDVTITYYLWNNQEDKNETSQNTIVDC
jgi:hypothetical protein